ncbi:HAD family hydrolase [Paenibacillus puldeungensis]|uniref:HAD family hydrolase n=1 Tax=Paenibacillus puldeungensis TaxID=696536 RepID=A0ABW3RXJ4_9BACL
MPSIQVRERLAPCRGILFDKDGTLLDFMGLWGGWAEILTGLLSGKLEQLGVRGTELKRNLLGLHRDSSNRIIGYDKAGPFAMATEAEVTALLASQLYEAGVPWNDALSMIREFNKTAMEELKRLRNVRPLPGLNEFLAACRSEGIVLGVVTSDITSEALEHLEWLGIRGYFQSVVGQDRVEKGKPEPDMLLLACRELGITPKDAVIIGDSNADMQMGKKAGVSLAVGISEDGEKPSQATSFLFDADAIVSDYKEIKVVDTIGGNNI